MIIPFSSPPPQARTPGNSPALSPATPPDNLAGLVAALLARIAHQPPRVQLAALARAAIDNGGSWYLPAGSDHWPASHMAEISLFGITGMGDSPEAAAASWIRAATRQVGGDAA